MNPNLPPKHNMQFVTCDRRRPTSSLPSQTVKAPSTTPLMYFQHGQQGNNNLHTGTAPSVKPRLLLRSTTQG